MGCCCGGKLSTTALDAAAFDVDAEDGSGVVRGSCCCSSFIKGLDDEESIGGAPVAASVDNEVCS